MDTDTRTWGADATEHLYTPPDPDPTCEDCGEVADVFDHIPQLYLCIECAAKRDPGQ